MITLDSKHIKRVAVDRHAIARGESVVFHVHMKGKSHRGTHVQIHGDSAMVHYGKPNPLVGGASVYLETRAPITITEEGE